MVLQPLERLGADDEDLLPDTARGSEESLDVGHELVTAGEHHAGGSPTERAR